MHCYKGHEQKQKDLKMKTAITDLQRLLFTDKTVLYRCILNKQFAGFANKFSHT